MTDQMTVASVRPGRYQLDSDVSRVTAEQGV